MRNIFGPICRAFESGFHRLLTPRRYSPLADRTLPDAKLVRIKVDAVCHDCEEFHRIECDPWQYNSARSEWQAKHRGHSTDFISVKREIPRGFDDRALSRIAGTPPWWLSYSPNANVKLALAADAAFTITLASLATSATWVTGREATSVSNTTNLYPDYDLSGKVTTGTTPTVDTTIELRWVKPINDTPTWPDVFDGTDSAETITNTYIRDNMVRAWEQRVSASSDIGYPIQNALTALEAFGFVPDNFTVFLAHSTAVNLNATAGNHEINYRGSYFTVI